MNISVYDAFRVFGLTDKATFGEVKNQYRNLALRWHPDKKQNSPQDNQNFAQINKAYKFLTNFFCETEQKFNRS